MKPLVEGRQPQEADGADQGKRRTDQQKECHRKGNGKRKVCCRIDHSITSPRIRNFASATVETKPSSPITSAASK